MKTLILDATELRKDFLCAGLKYQLLEHTSHMTWVNVYVPASAFEETVANYSRALEEARGSLHRANRDRRNLGLHEVVGKDSEFDFRAHLGERFDSVLGITVMEWPKVSHEELVRRAVNRIPPFDQKGSGYRDSLVWADVVALARSGHQVALVSDDKIFAGPDRQLALELRAEIDGLAGTVELVTDFAGWLIAELPWESGDLAAAVERGRDDEFYNFYLQSDLQDDLVPGVEDMGFRRSPELFEITEVRWDGGFDSVGSSASPDGVVLTEYDIDQVVDFRADFPEGTELEEGWEVLEPDTFHRVHVRGETRFVVRLAVLFGNDFGFSVEQLSWRRRDGRGPGVSLTRPDPNQLSLL